MTPGPFMRMLSEALSIPYGKVEGIRRIIRRMGGRRNVNRGPATSHIEPEEAAELLVAICAAHAGFDYERSACVAMAAENGETDALLAAVRNGDSYTYWHSKAGDLRHGATISAGGLQEIFDLAFARDEAA